MINGIVVVDKSVGMTSHDVVGIARKLFRTKRIGHTGTLDPDATGVLVLCLGNATRLAEYLSASRKNYTTTMVFGIETDTEDASGQVLAERDASHLTAEDVYSLLPTFRGTIQQIPPMVSALHHEGQRLYDLARQGITVEREARSVSIDRLELLEFLPGAKATAMLDVTCSTGTYIRTLVADIGKAAGTGGMMRDLRRTWVGSDAEHAFTLQNAYTLDALREREQAGTLAEVLLPLTSALGGWPQIRLDTAQVARIRHGQTVALADIDPAKCVKWPPSDESAPVALLDETGDVIAVALTQAGHLQPHKVFAA